MKNKYKISISVHASIHTKVNKHKSEKNVYFFIKLYFFGNSNFLNLGVLQGSVNSGLSMIDWDLDFSRSLWLSTRQLSDGWAGNFALSHK